MKIFSKTSLWSKDSEALAKMTVKQLKHFIIHLIKHNLEDPKQVIGKIKDNYVILDSTCPINNYTLEGFIEGLISGNPWTYAAILIFQSCDCQEKWTWTQKFYQSVCRNKIFPENWKTFNTKSIAKCIVENNEFSVMPILADALEDENCTDTEVLDHLRYNEDMWCPADWVLTNLTKEK